MVTMDKHDRDQWQKYKIMFPIYDDVEAISALYSGHGSFAVVRNGNEFKKAGFIPLTPRHMDARNWRGLYWLGVKRLVVYGREFGSLCDACFNAIPCLQAGRGRNANFRCKVTDKLLTINVGRRDRGSDRAGA
jgi:hypothetical protein